MILKIIPVILSTDRGLFGKAAPFKMAACVQNAPRLRFQFSLLAAEQLNYNICNESSRASMLTVPHTPCFISGGLIRVIWGFFFQGNIKNLQFYFFL